MIENKSAKKIKVAVGMSGGVDSSVAAALLKQQGYDVVGVFMRFWSDPTYENDQNRVTNKCCSVEAMMDARRVAAILDIPLVTLNLTSRFKEYIVDNFLEAYESGKTPNPCVVCNQFIKIGYFLDQARELGCDYIATGHYVKKVENADGSADLYIPKDEHKDQTYFLYRLSQEVVKHSLFPLGDFEKTEVRAMAEKLGLPVAKKKESFEISFVPDADHNDFLKRWVKMKPGDVLDTDGKIIGRHDGLPLYTIGQRKGLNLDHNGPWYVVAKKHLENQLIATNNKDYPGLFAYEIIIEQINWLNREPLEGEKYTVKLRHMQKPVGATVKKISEKEFKLIFNEGQRAVTAGQSAVIYQNGRLVGGGIIS